MRAWAALSLGLFAVVGCGSNTPADPTVIPLGDWGREAAAVECAQIFGCCDATERVAIRYADEAQCREMIADLVQSGVTDAVRMGLVLYDGKAARRCIDETTAFDCLHLPDVPLYLLGPSCRKVTPGASPAGSPCEDLDGICQSAVCNGTCAAPGPCWNVTCDIGQYCEPALPGCAPVKADGAACADNFECTPPSVCMRATGVCGPPLSDGAACEVRGDCASSNCSGGTGSTQICQPRLCDGV